MLIKSKSCSPPSLSSLAPELQLLILSFADPLVVVGNSGREVAVQQKGEHRAWKDSENEELKGFGFAEELSVEMKEFVRLNILLGSLGKRCHEAERGTGSSYFGGEDRVERKMVDKAPPPSNTPFCKALKHKETPFFMTSLFRWRLLFPHVRLRVEGNEVENDGQGRSNEMTVRNQGARRYFFACLVPFPFWAEFLASVCPLEGRFSLENFEKCQCSGIPSPPSCLDWVLQCVRTHSMRRVLCVGWHIYHTNAQLGSVVLSDECTACVEDKARKVLWMPLGVKEDGGTPIERAILEGRVKMEGIELREGDEGSRAKKLRHSDSYEGLGRDEEDSWGNNLRLLSTRLPSSSSSPPSPLLSPALTLPQTPLRLQNLNPESLNFSFSSGFSPLFADARLADVGVLLSAEVEHIRSRNLALRFFFGAIRPSFDSSPSSPPHAPPSSPHLFLVRSSYFSRRGEVAVIDSSGTDFKNLGQSMLGILDKTWNSDLLDQFEASGGGEGRRGRGF